MSRLLLLVRFCFFIVVTALPLLIPVWFLFGIWGIVAVAGTWFLILTLLLSFSDRWLAKSMGAVLNRDQGLEKTYRHILTEEKAERAPGLYILPTSAPVALTARGLQGDGKLFFSQGLLSLLTSDEFFSLLRFSYKRCKKPDIVFSSMSAMLTRFLGRLLPGGWGNTLVGGEEVASLSFLSAIPSLMFLPYYRIFVWLGRPRSKHARYKLPLQAIRVEKSLRAHKNTPVQPLGLIEIS